MAIRKVEANIQVAFFKEDGCFIAYCPALDLSACGDSMDDAMKSFEKSFELFLEDVTRKGTLTELLLDLGWTVRKSPTPFLKSPFFRSVDDIISSVPNSTHSKYLTQRNRSVKFPVLS